MICVDEMGALSVRPYPGHRLVRGREGDVSGRAKRERELDRDRKFGASGSLALRERLFAYHGARG